MLYDIQKAKLSIEGQSSDPQASSAAGSVPTGPAEALDFDMMASGPAPEVPCNGIML